MHVPKKLVSPGRWLWWPTSVSCMASAESIFGLGHIWAVSHVIMVVVLTEHVIKGRQTYSTGNTGGWVIEWQTCSAYSAAKLRCFTVNIQDAWKPEASLLVAVINLVPQRAGAAKFCYGWLAEKKFMKLNVGAQAIPQLSACSQKLGNVKQEALYI